MRIANNQTSAYAARREPFTTNTQNMYGEWIREDRYVVFSYGDHFPMYIWTNDMWFETTDSYSSTTSRHMAYARLGFDTAKLSSDLMRRMVQVGYAAFVAWRLKGGKV